jgi:hypothetical protein
MPCLPQNVSRSPLLLAQLIRHLHFTTHLTSLTWLRESNFDFQLPTTHAIVAALKILRFIDEMNFSIISRF